jgi:hypothetical protein
MNIIPLFASEFDFVNNRISSEQFAKSDRAANLVRRGKKISSGAIGAAAIPCDVIAPQVGRSKWAPIPSGLLARAVIFPSPIYNNAESNLIWNWVMSYSLPFTA